MKLKKLFAATLLMTAMVTTLNAQNYKGAFGLRMGYESGFTLKNFFSYSNATEFILTGSPHYIQLAGLYEFHQPIPDVNNLNWFVGIGAHLGGIYHKKYEGDNRFLLGADLIGGVEYTFPKVPFNLSLDWKPAFNFLNDYNSYWFYPFSLSFHYTFK